MAVEQNSSTNGEGAHAVKNRRQWARSASDLAEITVVRDTESHVAAVIDESFGGIGILMKDVANVVRGDQLKMLYRGVPVMGVVRRIQAETEGHHVGLEWLSTRRMEPGAKNNPQRKRTAHFLSFSGFCVSCHVAEQKANGQLQAALPDGSTCNVSSADLVTRSVAERRAELEHLSLDLTMLSGVYQLGDHATKAERIEAILDFEFERKAKSSGELIEQIRNQNKTILDQSQRIDELESYLGCIVTLVSRVKELELELESSL